MPDAKALYDADFVAWSRQQAKALRAAARPGSNQDLDWENLAEEIEGLGRSERSAVGRHVMRIVQHLAKLDVSPDVEPRNGWRRTIRLARLNVGRRLEENPSLKAEIDRIVEDELPRGLEAAIADLEEHGEVDAVEANAVRRLRYTSAQILGDWFPPEAEA